MSEVDEQLASLAADPRWQALQARAKERLDREFNSITRAFIYKDVQPDYGDLQYRRGVFAGIKFLLDQPDLDAKKLEKLLAEERGET